MAESVEMMTPSGASDSGGSPGDYILVESGNLEELRGPLRRSARLKFTCMDVSSRYIALGSNTGSVYVFDRNNLKHLQVVFSELEPSPVNVVALCPVNRSVAFSTVNGYINVMEMNIEKRMKPDKLRIINNHLHTTVTCLQWDSMGERLFSADLLGKVIVSIIPMSKVKNIVLLPDELIMKLESAVVQLDWFSDKLLVSTMQKVCLCNTLKQQYSEVGKKPREGAYGGMFYVNPSATVPLIYSARPGSRLWEVDFDGNVLHTHQFKQMLAVPPMPILKISKDGSSWTEPGCGNFPPQGVNFPQLKMIGEQFVLSWNRNRLYIMDPANDDPSLVLWSELQREIQSISCVGTDIYIFFTTSEIQKLQLFPAAQGVTVLVKRQEWYLATKICRVFLSSLLRLHHRTFLSSETLSLLWEKMSETENEENMEILSRILLRYDSDQKAEQDEDRNSDNATRSRSSSGASIVRLNSGIYQISSPRHGSNVSLNNLVNEVKSGSDVVKKPSDRTDGRSNGYTTGTTIPNGEVQVAHEHSENGVNENGMEEIPLEDHRVQREEVQTKPQESLTEQTSSETQLSGGGSFSSVLQTSPHVLTALPETSSSNSSQSSDLTNGEGHDEVLQGSESSGDVTEKKSGAEEISSEMKVSSLREINPMIDADDIFADDDPIAVTPKKQMKRKKRGRGTNSAASSKDKRSETADDTKTEGTDLSALQSDDTNETYNTPTSSEKFTDDIESESNAEEKGQSHTDMIVTRDESDLSVVCDEADGQVPDENKTNESSNFIHTKSSEDAITEEVSEVDIHTNGQNVSESFAGSEKDVRKLENDLVLSANVLNTEIEEDIGSISEIEEADVLCRVSETGHTHDLSSVRTEDQVATSGVRNDEDVKGSEDRNRSGEFVDPPPLIARGAPVMSARSPVRKMRVASVNIVNPGEEGQQQQNLPSPGGKRSYKRIQSFGTSSVDVTSKGLRKRASLPDLKSADSSPRDVDPDRRSFGSSPSDSPLTQSWEGPEPHPSTSPKISLMAVRDKVQSKLTNTKMKILKTIKERKIQQAEVPNDDMLTAQMEAVIVVTSQSETSSPTISSKDDATCISSAQSNCLIDLSDLRASTDQSQRALQNPRVLLDAELSREVLLKWVSHLNIALQQLVQVLQIQRDKKSNTKTNVQTSRKDISEEANVDEVHVDSKTPDPNVSELTSPNVGDDMKENKVQENQKIDEDVPLRGTSAVWLNVCDPFCMDEELRTNVAELAKMCYSTQCYGAISNFSGAKLNSGKQCSIQQCSEGESCSHSCKPLLQNHVFHKEKDLQGSLAADKEVPRVTEEILRQDQAISSKDKSSDGIREHLYEDTDKTMTDESDDSVNESSFIRSYYFLMDTKGIQHRIYNNEFWNEANETRVYNIWCALLECMQAKCEGDTLMEKILHRDIEDALDMMRTGLYSRENALAYVSKLVEQDPSIAVQFLTDCVHIQPLDVLFLCKYHNVPTQQLFHQYMCTWHTSVSKAGSDRSSLARVVYPVAKEWLSVLLCEDSPNMDVHDNRGKPRVGSHKVEWQNDSKIQAVLAAPLPDQWQTYLRICSKYGYWLGCLKMLKNLGRTGDIVEMIFHLGDPCLLCTQYYVPSTEEEWTDFVGLYTKFHNDHSKMCTLQSSESSDTSKRNYPHSQDSNLNSCHHHGENDITTKVNQSDEGVSPTLHQSNQELCNGNRMTWMEVADLLLENLGATACIKILSQVAVDIESLSEDFYHKTLMSSMIEKCQRNVSHNLLEKIDSYLWAQKPYALMPQLHYAVSVEKATGKTDSGTSSPPDLTPWKSESVEVGRYREDYECHWGVSVRMSRCRVCNLPLTEAVSHIVPGILVYPCGHGFHRFCCGEQQCLACLTG